VEEDITFHDQVGYWLWEPATGLVQQTLAIPRGQVLLASGHAKPDDAAIVVTATRGVELGERGVYGPGVDLHDDVVRVPLLVKLPRGAFAGTRVPWQVRAVDIAPTLVEAAGLRIPGAWQGEPLVDDWFEDDLARLRPPAVEPDEAAPAFHPPGWADHPGSRPALVEQKGRSGVLLVVRDGGLKLARLRGGIVPTSTCFDLLADPTEAHPRPSDDIRCRRVDIADALLDGWSGVRPPPTPVEDPPIPEERSGSSMEVR